MPTPRFYFTDEPLTNTFWINNAELIGHWRAVFHMTVGSEVILFDGATEDRLYKIIELEDAAAKLQLVTELVRQTSPRDIHLLWPLYEPTRNEKLLRDGTKRGIRTFVPLLSEPPKSVAPNIHDHAEAPGFDLESAQKIVTEAAELSGRSDIPIIREPISLEEALGTYADQLPLYLCEQGAAKPPKLPELPEKFGLILPPEAGWATDEVKLIKDKKLPNLQATSLDLETILS